jgi:class 3 adenylate cyclase
MPTWNLAYIQEVSDKLDSIVDGLDARLDSVVDGRIAPALEDIAIGSGRKMRAAILFFDIRGFTKRTSSANLEKLKETLYMLDCVIPIVMKIIYDHNGYIEKNTGDGVMAIIGAEESDEVSANNALDTATAIFYAIKHIVNPHLESVGIEKINARIGIDMGTLLFTRIGLASGTSKSKRNFLTAVGPCANLASKIQNMANTNEIWTGDLIKSNCRENRQSYFIDKTPANWTWSYNNSKQSYKIWNYNAVKVEPKQ